MTPKVGVPYKIVDIHPNDAYARGKKEYIGKYVTFVGNVYNEGGGWFGGWSTVEDRGQRRHLFSMIRVHISELDRILGLC